MRDISGFVCVLAVFTMGMSLGVLMILGANSVLSDQTCEITARVKEKEK